jgi:hypothetical protein
MVCNRLINKEAKNGNRKSLRFCQIVGGQFGSSCRFPDQPPIFCGPVLLSPEHRPTAQNRERKRAVLGARRQLTAFFIRGCSKMRMLILWRWCAKSPPAQSREGHRAAPCALSGLATLSRSWLCAGGCGRAAHLHHRGERSTGHGKIGAGYRDARAGHGL